MPDAPAAAAPSKHADAIAEMNPSRRPEAAIAAERQKVQQQRAEQSRGIIGKIIKWVLLFYFLASFYTLYVQWTPPECDEALQPCMGPMFAPEQKVDVYVYTTLERHHRWRADFATLMPLWNATGLDPSEGMNATLMVQLPASVRNNGSLYAHIFMVRAGMDPNPANHTRRRHTRSPDRRQLSEHVEYHGLLHSGSSLTRIMAPIASKRSNLLSSAGNTTGEVKEGAMLVQLPLGQSVMVFPAAAIGWVTAGFAVLGVMKPSAAVAVVRYAAVPAVAFLYKQHLLLAAAAKTAELRRERKALLSMGARRPVAHWKPSLAARYVSDSALYAANEWPPKLYDELIFREGEPMPVGKPKRYAVWGGDAQDGANGVTLEYKPPFYVDDSMTMLWNYAELTPNVTNPPVQLMIELVPVSRVYYQVIKTIEESTKMWQSAGFTERDLEEIKYMFGRSNIQRMAVLQVISIVQMFLSGMAFKNDISFFAGRKDYAGLSAGSLQTQFLISLIIFLYLYDSDYTSRLVLWPMGGEVLISFWKVAKRMHLGVRWAYMLPWASWAGDSDLSAAEKHTEEIDAKGMRYLYLSVVPIVASSGFYSLYHYTYKSWWSWLISSLANGCYMFGFINMCPQIFINYKFKSVAHLPWRVFFYKAFNTFIDDAVAFGGIINMPAKHRWMTLRDDLVFFVVLYQRYLYPIDKKRADEFGLVYDDDTIAELKAEGEAKPKPKAVVDLKAVANAAASGEAVESKKEK